MERELEVESGKLLLMPVRDTPRGPMAEYCLLVPIRAGKFLVYTKTDPHPDKVKKLRTKSIRIVSAAYPTFCKYLANARFALVGEIKAISPSLLIGDLTFFYSGRDKRANADYGHASVASKDSKNMGGSFENCTGETAVCIRLGDPSSKLSVIIDRDQEDIKSISIRVYPQTEEVLR
jgi:hypothetical protein